METREPHRRRPRPRTGEGGRRLHSAGSAIVVSLVGLAIALFLNAPGLHKSATIQPEGWKRDVALAVTGPLESVSGALLLDRPRKALKSVLGREDDDVIDTAVAAPKPPPGTTPPVTTPETPAQRVKFTPKKKLGVWIAGDSLVIVPGESLLRAVAGNRAVEAADAIDGRIASGLERPDVFNWFTHVRDVMERDKPRAVVLMFGGNDDHNLMTGLPEGREVGTFGSPTWRAEYRRRVASIMDTVTRNGAYLVWIGLPITRDADQTLRYDVINSVVQTEAAKREGSVSYLDTYFFFAGEDGGYAQYVEDSTGKLVKMRADDGVHFERPAGDIIAGKVLQRLEARYDFTSWRGG
jgi:hypothetical protein